MWSTCSERGASRGLVTWLGALLLWGCATQPAPRWPRPALRLPATVAARYALPGRVELTRLERAGGTARLVHLEGELRCGPERAVFHLVRPERVPGVRPPWPFVLTLPILGGGRELMRIVGAELARRGHVVGWAERVGSALRPGQTGPELERMLRRTVVHNRMLVDWAAHQDWVDPDALACVGMSMGGMIGCVLLAAEPRLTAGALCLAGGDLPQLVLRTTEGRAVRWRRWRRLTDGIGGDELRRELDGFLVSDPARLGPYVDTEKVLLVGGRFDEVVPRANQDVLWESLGRPRRLLLPLGHYTSALALEPILSAVDRFFADRFRANRPPTVARR